ncbi:uncharacterized protein [Clytia hemisphaerica]|uniref:Chitin-binding type-2 domain-containing protein n=1 Tax=Clytia hemisphaerica TaxID=252671 RepID=A0A7M6DNS6_9CNID
MKTIILIAIFAACSAEFYHPCPDRLCHGASLGSIFGLGDKHRTPDIFVQCAPGAHGKLRAVCQRCPRHQVFSRKFSVCVRRTFAVCKGKHCKPHAFKPHPKQCPKSLCADYPHSDYVVFRYPHKPTYYVQCTAGSPVCRQCPHGLIFNNDIKVCDFPPAKKH